VTFRTSGKSLRSFVSMINPFVPILRKIEPCLSAFHIFSHDSPPVSGVSIVITFRSVYCSVDKSKETIEILYNYSSVRRWITRHKPKPVSGLCEDCNKRQYRYLVNVTRKYTRDFTNWKYLCLSCRLNPNLAIAKQFSFYSMILLQKSDE